MNARSRYANEQTHVPRRLKSLRETRLGPLFWILSALLVLVFFTGGNARADAPFLFILRPVAVIVAAYGLTTMRADHWRAYRHLLAFAGAIVLLTVFQLIPMPARLWHILPAHELVRIIDQSIGTPDQWRPLSLVPSGTLNALYAISVPLAALVIAIQLTANERIGVLHVFLALSGISMVTGLLQAAGIPINLYYPTDASTAVEAAGLFANRNHQAALLATMLPMLAVASRLSTGKGYKARAVLTVTVGCGALIIPLLIVTGSRAGLLLGALAVFMALFYDLLPENRFRRISARTITRWKIAAGIVVLGLSALVTVLSARGLAFARLENIGSELRPEVWLGTLKIIPDYLPWGSGIGSFVEVYSVHEPLAQIRETYFNHAHNDYLEIALTAGIPGLLLLAVAAFCVVRAMWHRRGGLSSATVLARLGGAIVIVLAWASVTDYPVRTPLLAVLLAIAVTWLFGPASSEAQSTSAPGFSHDER